MKLVYGKQVYDQLPVHDQMKLKPVPCRCTKQGSASIDGDCEDCLGGGVIYEDTIHPDDLRTILDNLRSQGVPIPKDEGTQ